MNVYENPCWKCEKKKKYLSCRDECISYSIYLEAQRARKEYREHIIPPYKLSSSYEGRRWKR